MSKNTIKRLWIFIAFVSLLILLPAGARAEKRIGFLLFSEENRHYEVKKGVIEQLDKEGFREPAVHYITENAKGSKSKAAEIAEKYVAEKMDLIVAIGTSAAIAAVKATKDVPIVFSLVYDPVEAGISKGLKSSGNNTTGSSTRIPMSRLVNALKKLTPVKRLAVLYTPGEKYTEIILKELQGLQAASQVKIIPVPLTKKEELEQFLPQVVHTVDAISLPGSNIYYSSIPLIVDMANKEKMVTITHIEEYVEKGVLMGICPDPYRLGRLAGEKVGKILRGAKPSSIPIESLEKLDFILNMRTVKAGQFRIPQKFMKTVTKTIE